MSSFTGIIILVTMLQRCLILSMSRLHIDQLESVEDISCLVATSDSDDHTYVRLRNGH